jgi:hypothetical protein
MVMADLFPASENSLKSKLQSAVQRLSASNIFIGTSSWKFATRSQRVDAGQPSTCVS